MFYARAAQDRYCDSHLPGLCGDRQASADDGHYRGDAENGVLVLKYVLALLLAVVLLFPLYWQFQGSLQDIQGIMRMPPAWVPAHPTLRNYEVLLKLIPVYRQATNSILVATGVVSLSVLLGVSAGYAFAMYQFPGKHIAFWVLLISLMIPRMSLVIPIFMVVRMFRLINTLWGVVLPIAFSPVGILLFRNYMRSMPQALFDSARSDGASEWQILRFIVLPLTRAMIAFIVMSQSMAALGDFLFQNLVLQNPEKSTMIVGLISAVYQQTSAPGAQRINPIGSGLAAGVLIFLPIFAIFCAGQRYFGKSIVYEGLRD